MKVFVIGSSIETGKEREFNSYCENIGLNLADKAVCLAVCSPFPDSSDFHVIKGIKSTTNINLSIELYYPRIQAVEESWDSHLQPLEGSVKITWLKQEAPLTNDREAWKNSWLFCQVQAIRNSDYVIVVGGKPAGSANLLVRIADAEEKEIIPIPGFGGVGEMYFERKKYQLIDKWRKENIEKLFENADSGTLINVLVNKPRDKRANFITTRDNCDLTFFISYSRSTPAEADFVEMMLRRRNYNVIRDENDIDESQDIPNAIKEGIHKSDIFIALWSCGYACSPWCFDELNIALESHRKDGRALWIFRVDDTRIVHPDARRILHHDTFNREALAGKILSLLEKRNQI